MAVSINQTQQSKGGLTELYLDKGTYVKSFYPVMYAPSAVKKSMMGDKHMRIHHRVCWNNCVPLILNEKYKKQGTTKKVVMRNAKKEESTC
jgi:hypothetical protein